MITIINPDERNIRQCEFIDVIRMIAPEFKVRPMDEFVATIQKGDFKAQIHYQLYAVDRDDGTKFYYLRDNFGTIASMPCESLPDVIEYLLSHGFQYFDSNAPQCNG